MLLLHWSLIKNSVSPRFSQVLCHSSSPLFLHVSLSLSLLPLPHCSEQGQLQCHPVSVMHPVSLSHTHTHTHIPNTSPSPCTGHNLASLAEHKRKFKPQEQDDISTPANTPVVESTVVGRGIRLATWGPGLQFPASVPG